MKLGKIMLGAVCLLGMSVQAHAGGDVDAAIAAAIAANKAANDKGYEWRDSQKMIKAAQEAAKAGDAEKALKLAKSAELQGEMAQKQADAQQSAGPRF